VGAREEEIGGEEAELTEVEEWEGWEGGAPAMAAWPAAAATRRADLSTDWGGRQEKEGWGGGAPAME
jgi:hypothetical protein